jgi:hypothetical protein
MKRALLAAAMMVIATTQAYAQACATCPPTCTTLPPVCRPAIQIANRPPPAPACQYHQFKRDHVSIHPVEHGQPCFKPAGTAPAPRLVQFCPPSAHTRPFVPGCVNVMPVESRPPTYCSLPPPPPVHLATVVQPPPCYGPPFHKPGINVMDRPLPCPLPVEPCCPKPTCATCPTPLHVGYPLPR